MVKSLAYMGVTSPGLAEWESFGPEVLGLEARLSENEDVLQLRMDDRHHRLAIHRGERNALLYLGWDAGDEDSLGTCFEVLQRSGVTSRWGTEEECWERQVLSMVVAEDPSGIRHELVSGQKVEPKSFRPGRAISEFVTGEQGMGHVVLAVPDLKAAHGSTPMASDSRRATRSPRSSTSSSTTATRATTAWRLLRFPVCAGCTT